MIHKKVLLDGWNHFGSGGYTACVLELRGATEIPGTRREERDSFIVQVFADFEGPERPVSIWRDVMRPDGVRV